MLDDEALTDPPNLDQVLQQAASPRAWKSRWLVLGISLAIVIVIVVASVNWGRIAAQIFPTHSTYQVTFVSDVSWAVMTLTSAGHQARVVAMSHVQFSISSQPSHVQASIQAPPFSPRMCSFTLPLTPNDSCRDRDGHDLLLVPSPQLTPATQLSISMSFTLQDLPSAQRQPLLAMVSTQVYQTQPQALLAAGSHFALGTYFKETFVVTMPLLATLQTEVDVTSDTYNTVCPDLCAGAVSGSATSGPTWHARTFVQQTWHITQKDGQVVGDTPENLVPHEIDFDLRYDPSIGQWSLADPLTDVVEAPLCLDGQIFVSSLFFTGTTTLSQYNSDPTIEDHLIGGCLLHLMAIKDSASADFLWRFGQLYAVNNIAIQAETTLPVASSQDLASFANGAGQETGSFTP